MYSIRGVCISDMIPFYLGKLFRQSGASDDVYSKVSFGGLLLNSVVFKMQRGVRVNTDISMFFFFFFLCIHMRTLLVQFLLFVLEYVLILILDAAGGWERESFEHYSYSSKIWQSYWFQ